jgi:hypothetical protein
VAWDQRFHDPIELPGRRKPLVTLRDAAQYIIKLPKAERELPQWYGRLTGTAARLTPSPSGGYLTFMQAGANPFA